MNADELKKLTTDALKQLGEALDRGPRARGSHLSGWSRVVRGGSSDARSCGASTSQIRAHLRRLPGFTCCCPTRSGDSMAANRSRNEGVAVSRSALLAAEPVHDRRGLGNATGANKYATPKISLAHRLRRRTGGWMRIAGSIDPHTACGPKPILGSQCGCSRPRYASADGTVPGGNRLLDRRRDRHATALLDVPLVSIDALPFGVGCDRSWESTSSRLVSISTAAPRKRASASEPGSYLRQSGGPCRAPHDTGRG